MYGGAYGQIPPQQQQYGGYPQQQQQQQPVSHPPQQHQQQQQFQYQQQPHLTHQQQMQQQQQPGDVMNPTAPTGATPTNAVANIVEPENENQSSKEAQQQQTIYVDTQHDDMVHDAQLDYYGTKLATCSSDRTIKVYDVSGNSYTHNATLTGHSGPIFQLAWSHPKYGSILASASFDSSVLIHRESRPGEWVLVKALTGLHTSSVNSVAFAPHEYGLVGAAASSDGRVSVFTHEEDDSWTVEYLKDTPLGVNAVSWAPYGVGKSAHHHGEVAVVQPMPPRLVTGGSDNGIRIWCKNRDTGIWEQEEFVQSTGDVRHKDWVRDVAWAPIVIPDRSVVASCSEDRTVIIWKQGREEDLDGEKKEEETKEDDVNNIWTPTVMHTFDDPVWRVSWSITGNILAVSSGDANVSLWKEGLDGSWNQVSQVDDVASSKIGAD